jgi:hypothetical protein
MISALANTSFDGITGPLSFSPVHRGREEGIAVTFKNNQGEAGPQVAGSWTTEGFEYPEGFTEKDIVWSTASGAMPKPAVTGGEAGVNTTFIAGIVAAAVVAVAAFCGYLRKRDKDAAKVEAEKADKSFERRELTMRREVLRIEHMNTKLQEDVAHLQEYNQAEVAMLENRVKGFQADLAKVEEATGAAEQGMQRLMIRADELKGKSVVGKGAFGEVYKSEFRGTTVAVKTMVEVSEANLDRFQHECVIAHPSYPNSPALTASRPPAQDPADERPPAPEHRRARGGVLGKGPHGARHGVLREGDGERRAQERGQHVLVGRSSTWGASSISNFSSLTLAPPPTAFKVGSRRRERYGILAQDHVL